MKSTRRMTKGMLTILLGLTVVVFVTETFAQGTWTTKAPMPTPRGNFGVGVVGDVVYAVGGFNNASGALATVEAYDPVTDTWSTKVPMSTPRNGVAVGVVGGLVYALGGDTDAGNFGFLASVEAYNPVTDLWSPKASMSTAKNGVGVGVINGILYAVGGSTLNVVHATLEAYDPIANTWTTKAPMPTARSIIKVEVVNGILYAIGGQTGSVVHATVEAYDPVSNTWSTKAPMPTARSASASAVVDGTIYIFGGVGEGCSFPCSVVEAYDPATDTWTTETPMPTARYFLAAGVVGGSVYAVGGGSALGYVGVLEVFNGTPLSLFFSDYLAGPSSPNLAIPTAKYDYSAQGLVRTQSNNDTDRPMVKTVLGSYLSTDFVYEVDVLRTTTSDMDISFVGFGQGTPNGAFFNEPANAFVFRIHNSPGFYRIDAAVEAASGAGAPLPALSEGIANFGNGVGTRFRITRIGDTVTLSVPSQNASRSFSISQYAAQLGLNGSNAYLFFGNTLNGTVFSNVTVTLPVSDTTPPTVSAPAPLTVECNSTGGVSTSDPAIQAWLAGAGASDDVDGVVPVSNDLVAGTCAVGATKTVTFSATDAAGNMGSATSTITVVDTVPPIIGAVSATPNVLWPPNHRMAPVSVAAAVSDACDAGATCQILSVTSNEPVNGLGDGDTAPDWAVTGPLTVDIRAERSGKGSGRVYAIMVQCTDASGNRATKTVTVTVPKSQGK